MTKRRGGEGRTIRVLAEDVLKAVAQRRWLRERWQVKDVEAREGPERLNRALEQLEADDQVKPEGDGWRLTEKGRARAVELVRAHRLVETWLARQEGRPARELHAEADRAEHHLDADRINELADSLNRPRFDPHGDPIPERAHDLQVAEETNLTETEVGDRVRIAHIEDEPEGDFQKIMEKGLAVELPVRIVAQSGEETVVELAGEWIALPHHLASHIEVIPLQETEAIPEDLWRLSALKPGEAGTVAFISPACMGPERRRLLDFGLVPGSEVRCEFASPFKSPTAYSVRGTTLGLRKAQASNIFIRKTDE